MKLTMLVITFEKEVNNAKHFLINFPDGWIYKEKVQQELEKHFDRVWIDWNKNYGVIDHYKIDSIKFTWDWGFGNALLSNSTTL